MRIEMNPRLRITELKTAIALMQKELAELESQLEGRSVRKKPSAWELTVEEKRLLDDFSNGSYTTG